MTALVWRQNQSCPHTSPTHAGPARHASIEVLPLPNHRPGRFTLYRPRPHQNPPDHAPPICLQASTLQAPPTRWTRLAGHQSKRVAEAWAEVLRWGLGCGRRRPLNRVIAAGQSRVWSAVCQAGRWREGHGGTCGATPVAALGAAGIVRAAGCLPRQPPRLGAGKGREGKLSWGGRQRSAGQV